MEGLANNDRATVNKFRYKYYLANVYSKETIQEVPKMISVTKIFISYLIIF